MENLLKQASRASEALRAAGQTVAVAESSAGGLIAASLLAVPGASAYFRGGGVVYTSDSKRILLDISDDIMSAARAATPEHAIFLARAVRDRLGADWGIGETGAAGPTGNRYGDDPGHSCVGVAGLVEESATLATGQSDRADNMEAFAIGALQLLTRCVERGA